MVSTRSTTRPKRSPFLQTYAHQARGVEHLDDARAILEGDRARTYAGHQPFAPAQACALLGAHAAPDVARRVLACLDAFRQQAVRQAAAELAAPLLSPVLSGVADPLLKLLGIGLGEMVVTVEGMCQACDDFALTKAADKSAALPGSTIVYTINFENKGTTTLNNLKVSDPTPAYTTYVECLRRHAGRPFLHRIKQAGGRRHRESRVGRDRHAGVRRHRQRHDFSQSSIVLHNFVTASYNKETNYRVSLSQSVRI